MGDVLEFPTDQKPALLIRNKDQSLMMIDSQFQTLTIYGTARKILAIVDLKSGIVNVTGDLDQASQNFWAAIGAMCPLKVA